MIDKILEEYEEYRTASEIQRKARISEIYKKIPRIEEIDKEIFKLGSENIQNIIKNPSNSEKINSEFKKRLKELENEKKAVLKENNIPKDYDKKTYRCELCKDTGFADDGKKCRCLKQRLINEAYSKSNLGDILSVQNFGTFSFDYYSKEKTDGISPFETMTAIYNRAKTFCENFDNEEKGLVFYGSTGLGKTFLSSCIAKEIIDSGKSVIYSRAARFFGMYEDYKFGRSDNKELIDEVYKCDLLIIDDLGTEAKNNMNLSFLFDVVSERTASGKKIIINTNFDLGEIAKNYSQRFTSRIFEFFIPCKFIGSDIRLQKMTGKP